MARSAEHARLLNTAQQYAEAPDEAWAALAAAFEVRRAEAGAHLVLAGDPLPDVFYVAEGLLRLYYTDRDGREWNKAFTREGGFAGSLASGLLGIAAPYGIQALEPATLLVARWQALEALYERYPHLERLGRRIAEGIAVKKEMRERAFLELTPTERYERFLRDEADLAARLPLYQIASYVGVTEVSLSRIRGRLARTTSA